MENTSFICPHCGQPTTITTPNYFTKWVVLDLNDPTIDKVLELYSKEELKKYSNKERNNLKICKVGVSTTAITCPNTQCNKLWLQYSLWTAVYSSNYRTWNKDNKLFEWQLLPESEAKALPNYIPQAIQDDYYEACRIRDLSPKASATLSRRCLQGMIRDFHDIRKGSLFDEIKELENKIDPLVWGAIDAVRSVGNIGAHMEKDINLIIDVDPNEAQLLIGLIEQLIDDWYIDRFNKEERLYKIKELANSKKAEKANKKKLEGGEK